MVILSDIQKRLILAIKQSGLTQTELARRLNIRQQTVQQYTAGKIMPALDTFANLCIILDVEPAEILGTNETEKKISSKYHIETLQNSGTVNMR